MFSYQFFDKPFRVT